MFHVQGQFINTMLKLFILVPFQFSDQVLHIKEKVNKNREWAVIKSGKTRLWLEHKNHGDINEAELTEKMKWGDTLCSINFLIFPRIINSLHTREKKIFLVRRSKEKDSLLPSHEHQDAYCFEFGSSMIFLATLEISSSHPVKITWSSTNG